MNVENNTKLIYGAWATGHHNLYLEQKENFIMKDYKKPFFCYSKKLRDELTSEGFKYVAVGKHDKTGNTYYLYMPTVELNEFLQRRREKWK